MPSFWTKSSVGLVLLAGLIIYTDASSVAEVVGLMLGLVGLAKFIATFSQHIKAMDCLSLLKRKLCDFPPLERATDSLRLITLHPGGPSDPIRCTLCSTTFANKPIYQALSYTWGEVKPSRTIWLNGQTFAVGMNLWSALYNLRHENRSRSLWVDAVCINQSNMEERNDQVSIMAFIYQRATDVLVWLDPYEGYSTSANLLIRHLIRQEY